MKQTLAWHFVGDTLRDGSPIPKDGVWLKHKGDVVICESGFHASLNPFDALQYAPGPILCRVAVRGEIIHQYDKLVASERMIICRMDATEHLRYFARMQSVHALKYWDTEPPEVVLDYLMSGDESIRDAARDAARAGAAARGAAWEAARGAAWEAARAAAWAAAWEAAWDAAWEAARAAVRAGAVAWDAAWDAAWAAAKKDFTDFVHECFGVTK